ncbi:hypothetical protein [Nocardioides sp. InS609-2]|uniref:hypothetical protein n=1 Tax=Nocardioides sp. InS609-2 TaxID=2760705 RepID=UPI0020BFEF52|nr:hypothetical protein [Nocardioides sp. InS609-2]
MSLEVAYAFLVMIAGALLVGLVSHARNSGTRVIIFVGAYTCLQFVIGTFLWLRSPGVDGLAYVKAADTLAASSLASTIGVSSTVLADGKQGYVYLLAVGFIALGSSPLVAVAINANLLGLLLLVVRATAEELRAGAGLLAMFIASLFPAVTFWGPQPLREACVWLLIGTLGLSALKISRGSSSAVAGWLVFIVTAIALLYFRGPIAIIAAAALALGCVFSGRFSPTRATLFAVGAYGAYLLLQDRFASVLVKFGNDQIDVSRQELASSSSGFIAPDTSNPTDMLVAMVRVLMGPLPGERSSAGIAAFEAILWSSAFVLAIVGARAAGSTARPLYYAALVLALSIAASSGNYGSMLRIRAMLIPLEAPLVAIGLMLLVRTVRRKSKLPVEVRV